MKKATVKTGLKYALVAGGVLALVPTVYGQGIGERTLDRMTMGTPQQVERGEEVFDDQCAECHGDEGLEPTELGDQMGARGFQNVDVERSGLYSIYDVVTLGYEYNDEQHPSFDHLRYQDRWAVAHYTHDLIDDPQADPDELVERVRQQARQGICDPEVREDVEDFATPRDDEQLQRGQQEFDQRCATCHGEDGRGVTPDARDLHDDPDDWVRGTSPFGIFETLEQGIEGTAMASFAHVSDDDLWAITHYVRENLIPEDNLEDVSDDEIEAICRSQSAPAPPDPVPLQQAKEFLADDADQQRYVRLMNYGPPVVLEDADRDRGQQLFQQSCAGCHGADGAPDDALGPYGKFPPYMTIEPGRLEPASAGGTYEDLADRVIQRAHASLPDRPTVASYTDNDWRDLQAWMVTFGDEESLGRDRIQTVEDIEQARQYLEAHTADVDDEELEDEELEDEQENEEELEDDEELDDEGDELEDDADDQTED